MLNSFDIVPQGKRNVLLAVCFLAFSDLLVTAMTLKSPLLAPGIILILIYFYYSFQKTFFGLCNIVLFHIFILKGTGQISYAEIFFGLYMLVVLTGWLFRKLFIQRQQIVQGQMSFSLAVFIGLCLFSIIPAVIFRSNIIKWFRELIPLLTYFVFFPFIDTVKTERHIKIIAFCFFVLSSAVALSNVIMYKKAIGSAVYLWELLSSRQTANEPLFVTMITIATSVLIFSENRKTKVTMALLVAVFSLSLALTFTRAYWVATVLSISFLILLVPARLKARIAGYVFLLSVGVLILFHRLFERIGGFILQALGERFRTLTQVGSDISTLNRIVESHAVLSLIKVNPVLGYGLGKTFSFHSLLPGKMPTWYVHNAYLYILFKIGILGLIFLMAFYFRSIINGYRVYQNETDCFFKGLILGIIALFLAFVPLSFSSPQFYQKDTVLVIALGAGMIEVVRTKLR